MQDEVEVKQFFLKEQIIDNGYDADIFQNFMNSLKINGRLNS